MQVFFVGIFLTRSRREERKEAGKEGSLLFLFPPLTSSSIHSE
jgi:hypothetical protein